MDKRAARARERKYKFMENYEELLFAEDIPEEHRSGYVAIIGRPNVGKSTLMNAYLGQKIAIVSEKPQTTRNQLLGILTRPDAQIIFVDTPGIHAARNKLGEYMVEAAVQTIPDADLILFMVDVSVSPRFIDKRIASLITESTTAPVLLVLNKADLLTKTEKDERRQEYLALGEFSDSILTSMLNSESRTALLEKIISNLPFGPRYYPEDQVTDQQERFIAAEMVREAVLEHTRQEIPHSVAVVVDQFKRRSNNVVFVSAMIYVEKESQKGIVIGKNGSMLKRIGSAARPEIEQMVDRKVYLELWVKVWKKWRNKEGDLRRLGYSIT